MDDSFYLKTPPDQFLDWVPRGRSGHYCISTRWCPCGHWGAGRRATTRADGKRGQLNLDVQEGNDGSR